MNENPDPVIFMEYPKTYENFPLYVVFLSNLFSISIYFIGAYILAGFGLLFSFIYLIYCLGLEIRLLKESCVNCYYYGKTCGFGKGKLCSSFFKKGNPQKFDKEISWHEMIPDFLVVIIPVIGGVIILINNFNWFILIIMIILFLLFFGGNAVIRGQFACKYCKQREMGCPADRLFN